MIDNFINGLQALFSLNNFLFMNVGLFLGIVFGAVPGLTVILAIVLFMPLTFGLDSIAGIIMLLGIYCGGTYGGSISAILIRTPGTPNAAATLLDGAPMFEKGQGKKALTTALVASTIGGIFSAFILIFAAPQIAKLTLAFGPPEYFTLAIFGLTTIISISSENIAKGLISGCLGIFVSVIGLDAISGSLRFTFNNIYLYSGIQLVPVLIGLFAISEILRKVNVTRRQDIDMTVLKDNKNDKFTKKDLKSVFATILRSSLIGTILGAIPGTGGGIASFLSYNEAKRRSKHPEEFGKGAIEGVAAAEAGNNGTTGATLIPLLTMGVPGDGTTAILLGAFMLKGLTPGPTLFDEHGATVFAIMIGLIFVNIFMYFQGKYLIKVFAKISDVPNEILVAILIVLCSAGAYSIYNSIFNVYLILIFGIISYILSKLGFSMIPMLLGVVLGPIAEVNLRRSLVLSDSGITIFFTRPISLVFIILTILFSFFIIRKNKTRKA